MDGNSKKTYVVVTNELQAAFYFSSPNETANNHNYSLAGVATTKEDAKLLYDRCTAFKPDASVVKECILTYTNQDLSSNFHNKRNLEDQLFGSQEALSELLNNTIQNEFIEHNYKSIEGCVIVNFSYEPEAHYAERFDSLKIGVGRECDLFTGNEERAFRINHAVLVPREEIETLTPKEAQKTIEEAFNHPRWRWINIDQIRIKKEASEIIKLLPNLNQTKSADTSVTLPVSKILQKAADVSKTVQKTPQDQSIKIG